MTGYPGGDPSGDPGGDPGGDVGSLGEEAAKLIEALGHWAQIGNEHVATGAAECTYCPVCQVISFVRGTSPDVKAHLASAATSLLQAAAGVLATAVPDQGADSRDAGVEKIDLSDDDWEED